MKPSEWKDRKDLREVVGKNALQETIRNYEEKLCVLHTENLNLKNEIKRLEEKHKEEIASFNLKIEETKKDLSTAYRVIQIREDNLKRLQEAIDYTDKILSLGPITRFFRLKDIDKAVTTLKRGY